MIMLAAIVHLLVVHGPDGRHIDINVQGVSSLREPQEQAEGHFAPGTHCLIVMSNGKFIATRETCMEIVDRIRKLRACHRGSDGVRFGDAAEWA